MLIKALAASAGRNTRGPVKQRGDDTTKNKTMGKLKPFLLTFIGVLISLAIINRVAALRNIVNGQ